MSAATAAAPRTVELRAPEIDATPAPAAEPDLCAELLAMFEVPAYQPPPLPDVATQILALSVQPNVAALDVVQVLERDQMLAGKVLRLVQSPLYAGRSSVTSLHEAVVRLGVRLIRDIVFEVALRQGVFNVAEFAEIVGQLNRHDTVVAYLARTVARRAQITAPEAFLAGLLHDVGLAGLLFGVAARSRRSSGEAHDLVTLWPAIDAVHEQASERLAELWRLPEPIRRVAGCHHDPVTCKGHVELAAAVRLAELICADFAADVVGPTGPDGALLTGDRQGIVDPEELAVLLGLDSAGLQQVRDDAERIVPGILWL